MKKPVTNTAASVRARLLQLAHTSGQSNNVILDRFCAERFLYRLSQSRHRRKYVLKGAMLFTAWGGGFAHRITRDTDLLGSGASDHAAVLEVFREICTTQVPEDGIQFDVESIRTESIRALQEYEGVRVQLMARLGSARIQVQVDVGFGDAVTPMESEFPSLLDFPRPVLRMYTKEHAIAEKFEAMVKLGLSNSRMKDYFDIWHLCRQFEFEAATLRMAIRSTFDRRRVTIPDSTPIGLTLEFAEHHQIQWRAFWMKSVRQPKPPELTEVVELVEPFIVTGLNGESTKWKPGGPWEK